MVMSSERPEPEPSSTSDIPIVVYNDRVLLDSGATGCGFTFDLDDLTDVTETMVNAVLADGTTTCGTKEGILRMAFDCIKTKKRYIMPLCPMVWMPSLKYRIVSVTTLASQGHIVLFEPTHVRIVMNFASGNPVEVHIRHPLYPPSPYSRHPIPFITVVQINNIEMVVPFEEPRAMEDDDDVPSLATRETDHSWDEADDDEEITTFNELQYSPSSPVWLLPYSPSLTPPSCGTPPSDDNDDESNYDFEYQDSDNESLDSSAAKFALRSLVPMPKPTPHYECLNVFMADLPPSEHFSDDDVEDVDPLVNVSQAETVNTDSTSELPDAELQDTLQDATVIAHDSGPSNMVLQGLVQLDIDPDPPSDTSTDCPDDDDDDIDSDLPSDTSTDPSTGTPNWILQAIQFQEYLISYQQAHPDTCTQSDLYTHLPVSHVDSSSDDDTEEDAPCKNEDAGGP
jgi:hypothetical protein